MTSLAALWCSILACDRACSAWRLSLHGDDTKRTAAMRAAWRAFSFARTYRTDLSRAEQWAEAESMLRSGRYWYRGGWRRWA